MTLRVGVLMGGRSSEREVSLKSGSAVYDALVAKNYDAVKIDPTTDLPQQIKQAGVDMCFIALHGKYGEDGIVQAILENMDVPYTGSGVLASALAMNKIFTKKILVYEGLPTPRFMTLCPRSSRYNDIEVEAQKVLTKMSLPVVVKASTQGSTIGISFVHKKEDLVPGIQEAFRYDREILVEQFMTGVEVTAAVLGNDNPVVLPLIEIVAAKGVYDYEAKYTPGMSDHIIPPGIPQEIQQRINELALATYRAIGCRGLARVDFIVSENEPYILEVNTIPGMTETSLFPDAARAAGIEFPDLIDKLVQLALENHA
ncbi:MAG: D-alanine--D-alanine ligase [Peptococcaceae bacterium]|nr:D-alanine--D-alanine ligase [Peptococcaceae bacterium]